MLGAQAQTPAVLDSALYTGALRHRRFRPARHEFTYRLFMAWLDVDRIPETMARTPWTGYNRFHWASFCERDHFGDARLPLRERVEADAEAHGVRLPDGPIFLLTHLRYLGYCFNPISLFYCFDRAGNVETVLAEVNSTFGETRNYWLAGLHHRCPKTMHVSPFMGMDLDYEFALSQPAGKLVAHMNTIERGAEDDRLFDATLTLERQPWNTVSVGAALARHPWMTAKVIGAIHWEALRLWMKKVPVQEAPKHA
jgi:DUF1365 family protein